MSADNTTLTDPITGRIKTVYNDRGLFWAMRGAGSSFGIVTEFLYKIYPKPETQPIIAMIFVRNANDIRKLEAAAKDGRYHVTWFALYIFNDVILSPDVTVQRK